METRDPLPFSPKLCRRDSFVGNFLDRFNTSFLPSESQFAAPSPTKEPEGDDRVRRRRRSPGTVLLTWSYVSLSRGILYGPLIALRSLFRVAENNPPYLQIFTEVDNALKLHHIVHCSLDVIYERGFAPSHFFSMFYLESCGFGLKGEYFDQKFY
ncbi:Trafficking protein particle complex subunit 2-like protein [Canna indica]|uniref:Trafficking protein particle complex subunit 2-like protein n=1 Tax=Canna indica TaxID=4628 RepID=A0AAQ3KIG6_9LILI|nr:Trafficking protein particle complex subunit 2-like protein [Canna indica]